MSLVALAETIVTPPKHRNSLRARWVRRITSPRATGLLWVGNRREPKKTTWAATASCQSFCPFVVVLCGLVGLTSKLSPPCGTLESATLRASMGVSSVCFARPSRCRKFTFAYLSFVMRKVPPSFFRRPFGPSTNYQALSSQLETYFSRLRIYTYLHHTNQRNPIVT